MKACGAGVILGRAGQSRGKNRKSRRPRVLHRFERTLRHIGRHDLLDRERDADDSIDGRLHRHARPPTTSRPALSNQQTLFEGPRNGTGRGTASNAISAASRQDQLGCQGAHRRTRRPVPLSFRRATSHLVPTNSVSSSQRSVFVATLSGGTDNQSVTDAAHCYCLHVPTPVNTLAFMSLHRASITISAKFPFH